MRPWKTPSFRNANNPQIEFCDLCGAMVAASDRVEATTEGLAGYWVCARHKFATNPSFNDLGGTGNAIPLEKEGEEPHSGSNWVNEDAEWE